MLKIAFQGTYGAHSDIACRVVFPGQQTLPCFSFDHALAAVRDGRADLAMLPIENILAGRVADVHHLLPEAGLYIRAEYFHPIEHHLLVVEDATLAEIQTAESHIQALSQCRKWLRDHNILPVAHADTAGAAKDIALRGDRRVGAIASALAGEIYGLKSLASGIADAKDNITRFLVLGAEPRLPSLDSPCITTLLFRVPSVPAALYKALGGFAAHGVNITKLESYLVDGSLSQFYLDVDGHLEGKALSMALAELTHHAYDVKVLGSYPADTFRTKSL